ITEVTVNIMRRKATTELTQTTTTIHRETEITATEEVGTEEAVMNVVEEEMVMETAAKATECK
ncbi:MAG: hypothetical protein ACM3P1_04730, partial [Candidatus Saccharibacteria bacterium]